MAILFNRIDIDSFRGLADVGISGLRDVNIIAGDNNSGKTSLMEALCLLRKPGDFYNVIKVARMRDNSPFSGTMLYENFISLFPRDRTNIALHAVGEKDEVHLEIFGEEGKTYVDPEMYSYSRVQSPKDEIPTHEVSEFVGELRAWVNARSFRDKIHFNPYMKPAYMSFENRRMRDEINLIYLSPLSHVQGNVFNQIVRNKEYKRICIELLQLFDKDIVDLLYLKNENTARAVEYVEHCQLGTMPLATYGDGIKKALSLANGIASAADGILLIDEIETSINHKYYNDIFSFVIMACRQFNVQLFITTHSMEAIDGLLGTQMYDQRNTYDPISVITMRKDPVTKTVRTRSLFGKEVYQNRERFGFEVRL